MAIKYRIVEMNPDEHQIVVRYYSDELPESSLASQVDADGNMTRCRTDYALTLPVPMPEGVALERMIANACPRQFFEIKAAVLDQNIDTSMSAIAPLLNVEKTIVDPRETALPAPAIADMVSFQP